MFRRRRATPIDADAERFRGVLEAVEEAKAALVSAVPSPRGRARPLADALFEFEDGLRSARPGVRAWTGDGSLRDRCAAGLEESLRRAEALRTDPPELSYETVVQRLGELLDPLEPFEDAARRLVGR